MPSGRCEFGRSIKLQCGSFTTGFEIEISYLAIVTDLHRGHIMRIFKSAILALSAAGIIWLATAPAKAQLSAGCSCPPGSNASTGNICVQVVNQTINQFPATCSSSSNNSSSSSSNDAAINQSVGHIAALQQEISFSGILSVLQTRRDQLQGTLGAPPCNAFGVPAHQLR